jgi:hydroxypyruvate reductase
MTPFTTTHPRFKDYRRHIDELVSAAVTSANPEAAVDRMLRREGRTLLIGEPDDPSKIDLDQGKIYLIAAGKASVPMARSAIKTLGADLVGGIILAKAGERDWKVEIDDWPVTLYQGSHPIPDDTSIFGTKAVVEFLSQTHAEDTVICLISGGASSLLTDPLVPLADWRKLIDLLLKSGGTIGEVNAIRRAVDRIKSGGLARAAAPAACYGLILSDVIGNPKNIIGGGPTVPEQDLVVGAVAVLGRYDIARKLERQEWQRLAVALNQSRFLHKNPRPFVRNLIIGDVRGAAMSAQVRAIQMGFVGQLLTVHMDGEARSIGRLAGAIARDLPPDHCLILGGETTVSIRGKGIGGRSQELALAAAISLDRGPMAAVACFGTDGEDGPTPAAGAVITNGTARLARSYGLDPVVYLGDNDSYTFFSRLDEATRGRLDPHLIITGPTGTNVNDLVVILSYGE